jgi:hypothetical protein
METAKIIAIDIRICELLKEPRFFSKGNSLGAFVGLIDPPEDQYSERMKINN